MSIGLLALFFPAGGKQRKTPAGRRGFINNEEFYFSCGGAGIVQSTIVATQRLMLLPSL